MRKPTQQSPPFEPLRVSGIRRDDQEMSTRIRIAVCTRSSSAAKGPGQNVPVQVHVRCATMITLVQRWGGSNAIQPSACLRHMGCFGSFSGVCPSTTKGPGVFPVYDRRDMAGTFCAWAINPLAPGFPIYPIFACPVSISNDGSLGTGDCTLNDNFTLTQQPSGKLTIDRTCHVIGSITYSICNQINGACSAQSDYAIQTSVSLWRSRDGSRLSGFQSWSCSIGGRGCGRTPPASVLPLELIEAQ